eukprot:CAMPEP_0194353950 /NCGR_PEP_ID=MMETSP0174-20130528/2154_1 /TAXON_ID=216777 /ORGANISM="Proboscia alata, Strain PI-D3" /LENGTH=75 /DNA_ID=CAMNT_0039122671 /DNA_START=20 /DNA_END=244 /DNA_ORIENTATION=+
MNDYTAPILANLCRLTLQTVVFGGDQPHDTHSLLGRSLSVSTNTDSVSSMEIDTDDKPHAPLSSILEPVQQLACH